MKTEHVEITYTPDATGSAALNRDELTACFAHLIGHTMRSVADEDVEIAFVDAFAEFKKD